ncbi:MAG: hypothetical protein F6K41_06000 [Symploca sp. SIO3E6]|nr:hypothetical protein [Caldora sp. SIO3E6]
MNQYQPKSLMQPTIVELASYQDIYGVASLNLQAEAIAWSCFWELKRRQSLIS